MPLNHYLWFRAGFLALFSIRPQINSSDRIATPIKGESYNLQSIIRFHGLLYNTIDFLLIFSAATHFLCSPIEKGLTTHSLEPFGLEYAKYAICEPWFGY